MAESYPQWGAGLNLWSLVLVLLIAGGCRTAPITGRNQLFLLPEDQEVSLGQTAFQDVMSSEKPSTNEHYITMVTRVGQRIAAVAGRADYQWEFRVFASPQQNAFCLPGGKVAVYEGILPICQNEAGLAVVMSHEIAHALARHGGERITQNYMVEGTRMLVSYVSQNYAQKQADTILKFYGIGSQYGYILRHSRKHESEADHIGVILMARAGYDPEEAPRFWQRFAASHQGEQPLEFFSTHPSDHRRSEDLIGLLPDARKEYEASPNKYGLGQMLELAPLPPAATPVASQGASQGTAPAPAATTTPAGANRPFGLGSLPIFSKLPFPFGTNSGPATPASTASPNTTAPLGKTEGTTTAVPTTASQPVVSPAPNGQGTPATTPSFPWGTPPIGTPPISVSPSFTR